MISERGGLWLRLLLIAATLPGWLLSLLALQALLDYRNLLSGSARWLDDGLIFVTREVQMSDTLGLTRSTLEPGLLEELRALPGTRLAEPVLRNHYPMQIRVGGHSFPEITSEVFVEALPTAALQRKPPRWDWQPGSREVPLLLPRDFLSLYNFGFAPAKGLPQLTEGAVEQFRFRLFLQPTSGGRAQEMTARVAGFSDQIQSVIVPEAFLRETNARLAPERQPGGSRVLLLTRQPDARALSAFLEQNNLQASGGAAHSARVRLLLDLALGVLAVAGLVILLLTLLLLAAEAEATLARSRGNLQRLFLLGHAPGRLAWRLIRKQLLSLVGSLALGVGLALVIRGEILKQLGDSGVALAQGGASPILLMAGLLFVAAAVALIVRFSLRLRQLYLSPL